MEKQSGNADLRETKQNIFHSKVLMRDIQKFTFLLNLSRFVKSYGHFCQILGILTMPAHLIWSSHVTEEVNLEKKLYCPNSAFNIKKSHQISSRNALYIRSFQTKTS